jgi:hypothetical protein
MNRIQKLKNDVYSFEELNTLEKNATKLNDSETLNLIEQSRVSKLAKGEKPKSLKGLMFITYISSNTFISID